MRPSEYSIRTRSRATARTAEDSVAPDSTLDTDGGPAQASSHAADVDASATRKPTYSEAVTGNLSPTPPDDSSGVRISNYFNSVDSRSTAELNQPRDYTHQYSLPQPRTPEPRPETLSQWERDNPNDPQWTRVSYSRGRRSRSQGETPRAGTGSSSGVKNGEILPALPLPVRKPASVPVPDAAIDAAQASLSREEQERIDRRNAAVKVIPPRPRSPSPDKEEGPSNKGKNIDPLNWGNINLSERERNVAEQQALLESFTALGRKARPPVILPYDYEPLPARKQAPVAIPMLPAESQPWRGVSYGTMPDYPRPIRRDESLPVNQIPGDSYLGRSLQKLDRLKILKARQDDDPSSSDSSSSSSSSDDDSDDLASPTVKHSNKSKKSKRRKSSRPRKQKTTLKPLVPKEYDGTPDARAYYRFLTEGTAYVTDGKVDPDRQVFILSYYLTGKAYDYYTQKVALNNDEWSLSDFFEGLFNYCFPVNFRSEQRKKLKKTFQNEKTVSAYVHELEELFNLIGNVTERDKIIKLWNGLRTSIQQSLWRDHYNPETSKWGEIVLHAEKIEIAEDMSSTKHHRAPNLDARHQNHNSHARRTDSRRSHDQNRGRMGTTKFASHTRPFQRENGERFRSSPHFVNNNNGSSRGPSHFSRNSNTPHRGFTPRFNNHTPQPNRGSTYPRQSAPPRPQLTDKERQDLLAAGKCFNCKETGHMSRNCPKNSTVRSSTAKPPGVSNFNIEFLEESEDDDSDEVLVVDSLSLGMVMYDEDNDDLPWHKDTQFKMISQMWLDDYCATDPVIEQLGDALIKFAIYALHLEAPYPGDVPSTWKTYLGSQTLRFAIYPTENDNYVVYDRPYNRCVLLPAWLLRQPYFKIAAWYADEAQAWSGSLSNSLTKKVTTGDPYGHNAAYILRSGISTVYPTRHADIDDEFRFAVVQNGLYRWDIHDEDFAGSPIKISIQELANPLFNIVNWYLIRRYGREHRVPVHVELDTPSLEIKMPIIDTQCGVSPYCKVPNDYYCSNASSDSLSSVSMSDWTIDTSTYEYIVECSSILPVHTGNGHHNPHTDQPVPLITPVNSPADGQVPLPATIIPTGEIPIFNPPARPGEDPELPYPQEREDISREEYLWDLGCEGRILRPVRLLGDMLGHILVHVLMDAAPYPGDPPVEPGPPDQRPRFVAEAITPRMHRIRDARRNIVTYFDHHLLLNPDFMPALEYAHRCAVAGETVLNPEWLVSRHERMGPLIESALEHDLQMQRPFIDDCDFNRRNIPRCHVQWNPDDHEQIYIIDSITRRTWYLPRYLIEYLMFDFATWFQTRLLISQAVATSDEYYIGRHPPGSEEDSFDIALNVEVVTRDEAGRIIPQNIPVFQSDLRPTRPPDNQ